MNYIGFADTTYEDGYNEGKVDLIIEIVEKYPNDADAGEALRVLYWKIKGVIKDDI